MGFSSQSVAELARAVGLRLRTLRQGRPRPNTLAWLAERTGMSCSFLSMMENGRRLPSLGALVALSQVLEVHPSELLAGDTPSASLLAPLAALFRERGLGPRDVKRLLRVAQVLFPGGSQP
jgi:transcriptional regulator with XRE-family HTH domain